MPEQITANKIARQLYAMSKTKKRGDLDVLLAMREERYQRTPTDEQFPEKPRAGFKPVDPEQKRMWEMLADTIMPYQRRKREHE